MSEALVREELQKTAGDLMALRRRLSEMAQSLPAGSLRSSIEGIVTDSLTPAVDGLLEASQP
jgi:hypothetical protein